MSKGLGWSGYNPHYSSLLLYQDKYGSTDRPFGKQTDPYMTSSGEKAYGVKGNRSFLHDREPLPLAARSGASYGGRRAYEPYTSTYSWEVQRQMVQKEVPYSRSVHALQLRSEKLTGNYDAKPSCGKCSTSTFHHDHYQQRAASPRRTTLVATAPTEVVKPAYSSTFHVDSLDRDSSDYGLHRRFPSTRIGTSSRGYSSNYGRPTRRFTVAGIYG